MIESLYAKLETLSSGDPAVLTEAEAAALAELELADFQALREQGLGPEHVEVEELDGQLKSYDLEVCGERLYTIESISVWNQLRRDGLLGSPGD